MEKWRWATAAELGRGIGAGDIDPVALTNTFIDAIASHPASDRIYAYVTADRARSEAKAAKDRASSGLRRGPLDGVPISWKDLFDTAGAPTEAGTKLMAGRVPERDAAVLQTATANGLVCLGKTHMSEIAFSGLGLNPMTATPPCVNDTDAVPGGSSSGAAASVAFGLAAAAIGSDTGGSVRIPSAWNDLTGLKTTHGRLTLEGVVPLCLTFDTVGPLCRSVEDASLLLAALESDAKIDINVCHLDGVTFGLLGTIVLDDMEDAPMAAFTAAVETLKSAGVHIKRFSFPELEEAFAFAGQLYTADSWSWWRNKIQEDPSKMYTQIYDRIRAGEQVGAADYIASWNRLRQIRKSFLSQTAKFDAILMPSAPILPPKVAKLSEDSGYYVKQNLLALRNTRVANLMNTPSISLPTNVSSCGIMLNGRPNQEEHLLRLASAVETALS